MMSESNNLLYHPNDSGFDRLEEMEGGELVRYPVLRSVPVPMPRPWGTRGAIALLMVCGVVFGIIAVVSLSSPPSASEAVTADNSANANTGGLSLVNGSGSLEPGTVESGSSSFDDSDLAATAEGTHSNTSYEASDDADSDSAIDSPDVRAEDSAGGSDASAFEDLLASPLESSTADSQFESFESSASDGFTSESASADSVDEESTSSSDSTDASRDDWLTESVSASQEASTSDSASAVDWQSSLSMSDESSDSLSRSEDGSFDF